MKDIAITWNTNILEGVMSFNLSNNDIEMDEGLLTSTLLSLFTDARASEDDILPDTGINIDMNYRGWWGDLTSSKQNDSVGSKLWLLERSKNTPEVMTQAVRYTKEALQWMIDEGIASKIEVVASSNDDILGLEVSIFRSNGIKETFNFDSVWEVKY